MRYPNIVGWQRVSRRGWRPSPASRETVNGREFFFCPLPFRPHLVCWFGMHSYSYFAYVPPPGFFPAVGFGTQRGHRAHDAGRFRL